MSKDPAFLFYTNDFLSGISDLTMEERGQFITLLCLQHQKGRLTNKMITISCGNAAADVLDKFIKDPDGLYYNERLEIEIEKRKQHAEKQRDRAIKGWKKRKDKDKKTVNATAYAVALPLENENENIDLSITYSVLELKEKYKKEKKVHKVICEKESISESFLLSKVDEFTNMLISQNRQSEYWGEYTKYFRNWLRLNKDQIKPKAINLNHKDENLIYFYWEHEGKQNIQTIEKEKSEKYFNNQEKGGYIAKVI